MRGAISIAPWTAPAETIDFLLSAKRDKQAAKRFFRKALGTTTPATRGRRDRPGRRATGALRR